MASSSANGAVRGLEPNGQLQSTEGIHIKINALRTVGGYFVAFKLKVKYKRILFYF